MAMPLNGSAVPGIEEDERPSAAWRPMARRSPSQIAIEMER
jgi:hypothetical protein